MTWGAIKRNITDKLHSDYIRMKSKGVCEYCGKQKNWKELDCSHFKTRRNKKVRWDERNTAAVCRGCHQFLSENPERHVDFFKKRLGKNYDAFIIYANTPASKFDRPDERLLRIYYKEKIKELERADNEIYN